MSIPAGSDFSIRFERVLSSVGAEIDLDSADELTFVISEGDTTTRVVRLTLTDDAARFDVDAANSRVVVAVKSEDYACDPSERYYVQLWVQIGSDDFATAAHRIRFAPAIDHAE